MCTFLVAYEDTKTKTQMGIIMMRPPPPSLSLFFLFLYIKELLYSYQPCCMHWDSLMTLYLYIYIYLLYCIHISGQNIFLFFPFSLLIHGYHSTYTHYPIYSLSLFSIQLQVPFFVCVCDHNIHPPQAWLYPPSP